MRLLAWTTAARLTTVALAASLSVACSRQEGAAEQTPPVSTGPTTPPELPGPPVPIDTGGLRQVYDSLSPHWPHLRVHISDYRIVYQSSAATRTTEYRWTGRHTDAVTLDAEDPRSVPQYRQVNPRASVVRYVLNWSVIKPGQGQENPSTGYSTHMKEWYASHPEYQLEDAFLHDGSLCPTGTPATEACRLSFKIWTQFRWAVNPGDPGLREYQRARLAQVAADADGVFFDEHGSGDMIDQLYRKSIREYPDWSRYQSDMVGLLGAIQQGLSPKRVILNTATYISSWDAAMIGAAAGAELEFINNPFHGDMELRWTFIEAQLAKGRVLQMEAGGSIPASYTPGNSASTVARQRLWELASYQLVAPNPPDALRFGPDFSWDQPFETQWLKGIEVDVGSPREQRRVFSEGKDPTGRGYRVWSRDLSRALVLVRPIIDWQSPAYGDATAVTLKLPTGERYLPLAADGTIGAPVESIQLRASEAAILLKGSTLATARGTSSSP